MTDTGAGNENAGEDGDASARSDREFGRSGWILVAAMVVSFFVVPGIIVAYPYVGSSLGLGFRQTYIVLPLVPAIFLGALAVWSAIRS